MSLKEVAIYLTDKLKKTNVNNPKSNKACRTLLTMHPTLDEDIEILVMIALQCMQLYFTQKRTSHETGEASLTYVSTSIGKQVMRFIQREPTPWDMHVTIGDLFVEAFHQNKYISLHYVHGMEGGWFIRAGENWASSDVQDQNFYRLLATTKKPPKNIYSVFQTFSSTSGISITQPIIKDWNEDRAIEFNKHLDKPWIKSINNLQQVAWSINTRVADLMQEHREQFVTSERVGDNTDLREIRRKSKWRELDMSIGKIQKVYNLSAFYQYVDTDYRGRIYYSEPFLNFQGSDYSRGVLQFAIGKPMTNNGNFWLAVHTACCFNQSYHRSEIPDWCEADYSSFLEEEDLDSISVDKMTLEDRANWTNQNIDWILDAGQNGTIHFDCEKPISFLAACIEWFDYDTATKEGRTHLSRLPIPVDGSNNGWQHLGAMSKDTLTGELVGLTPVTIQKDFYVQTAKELQNLTEDEELIDILNKMPMKHIRKGISKRGSMTRAYSAGAAKIGFNMWLDCRTEGFDEKYGITEDHCKKFARILIKAINKVCPGPLETMSYLQKLAKYEIGEYRKFLNGQEAHSEYTKLRKEIKLIYKKETLTDEDLEELSSLIQQSNQYESKMIYGNGKKYMSWCTPSGFPVEYTAFTMRKLKCRGRVSGKQIQHVGHIPTTAPDARKFMCGISPNFIHSMDATHMALLIANWEGDFGAVHDSFSTHACDVEDLLLKTKEIFINMYNVDNFYDYIEKQLVTDRSELDIEQPELGQLIIKEIENSDYFFA